MRVFLLGATGNSGRRILRFALDRGHEVTALVRDKSKMLRLIGIIPAGPADRAGDLGNASQTIAAMSGHDVVINAAGYVTEGPTSRGWCRPRSTRRRRRSAKAAGFGSSVVPLCSTSPVPA